MSSPHVNSIGAEMLRRLAEEVADAKLELSVQQLRDIFLGRLLQFESAVREAEGPSICANCFVWFNRDTLAQPHRSMERKPCRNENSPCNPHACRAAARTK